MLDIRLTHDFDDDKAWELDFPQCADWKGFNKRVLIFLQTIESRDIKAKGVLKDKLVRLAFINAINYSVKEVAKKYDETFKRPAFTVAPFNRKRHLNLKGQDRKNAEIAFADHAKKLIKKLKPTHVLVSGDDAFHAMFPEIDKHLYKRGWIHKKKIGDVEFKLSHTIDFSRLLEKKGEMANLLGFWCRHTAYLMLGKHPHSLKGLEPEVRYIDTIEKFDKLMDRLWAEKVFAVDTETKNLSVLSNLIYTIQFTLESNKGVGYVLPIEHPLQDCWSAKQIEYIKKRLRELFAAKPPTNKEREQGKEKKMLVGFNIMYDLRVIRRYLKIAIIWHDVWEITAGEHNLDENISELKNFGHKPGNLGAVLASYECEFYLSASFGKEDRGTIASVNPRDKGFQKYGAMDTVSLMHIMPQQIKASSIQNIESKNFKKYFVNHTIHQMGDTAHQLSHLAEAGSYVDVPYLQHLISNESPLKAEMAELAKEFKQYDEVQQANAVLIGDSGLKAKGLFGKAKAKAANWMFKFKPSHLRILFFDVMGMEPVNETKQGEKCVDKAFIAEHEARNPIVATYGDYAKVSKLLSTYAKGWLKKIRKDGDALRDFCIRAGYSFFAVATGRLNSFDPNLQQITSRGKLAKIIKHMFITQKGYLMVRYDYSAHEVRVWSYVGKDKVLAAMFKVGQRLRQMFIQDPSDANKKAIKEKGDLHVNNVRRLLGKVVDKDHPLRDAIKAVVFGLIYGKSAATLGIDTKLGDVMELRSKLKALHAERDSIRATL